MHYEINVALCGSHFFATHARSITSRADLLRVLAAIVKAFPLTDGYSVSVSEITSTGRSMDVAELLREREPLVRRWWREDLEVPAAKEPSILLTHRICSNCETLTPNDEVCLCKRAEDSCPGCGCEPGDGVTAECVHSEGCGFATDVHGAEPQQRCTRMGGLKRQHRCVKQRGHGGSHHFAAQVGR